MKKYLFRILVFIICFFLVNMYLDYLYKKKVNKISEHKDKEYLVYKDSLDVLFMGHSYILHGLNPKYIPNSFNYATSKENYIETYYKLKYLIEKHPRNFNTLVLPFDYFNFAEDMNKGNNDSYWIKYVDYFELYKLTKNTEYLKTWFQATFFSYSGKYKLIRGKLTKKKLDSKKYFKGYVPHKGNIAKQKNSNKKAVKRIKNFINTKQPVSEEIIWAFNTILQLCKEHNISVILVRIPVSKEYYEMTKQVIDSTVVLKKINPDLFKDSTRVKEINFQKIFFNNPELFGNVNHLNKKGGDSISVLFRNYISKPLKRQ